MNELWLFFGRFHPLLVHFPIGLLILAGILEALAAHDCDDANDNATAFELVSALNTWLSAGDDAQENADRWQDEIARPILDAYKNRFGYDPARLENWRDAVIAFITTATPAAPGAETAAAPPKPAATPVMEQIGEALAELTRQAIHYAAKVAVAEVVSDAASPFYRCRVAIDRAVSGAWRPTICSGGRAVVAEVGMAYRMSRSRLIRNAGPAYIEPSEMCDHSFEETGRFGTY